jgi:hypothetical protein
MPKAAVGQTSFNTGEVSPLFYGVTDNPRYKKGLETCLNYLPTLQGPLIRRPGTKYCANVKDSNDPPRLIPFQFSTTQNYILEIGNQYIRFYANNGQMITSGNTYKLVGSDAYLGDFGFFATRDVNTAQAQEIISSSVLVPNGSILELQTPYNSADDLSLLRWAQNGDTMYLVHPKYSPYKLQRQTQNNWKLQKVIFIDGPYLPLNSNYLAGDSAFVQMQVFANAAKTDIGTVGINISGAITDPGGSGQIQITTSSAHSFTNGQNVFIRDVTGTVEANNFSTYPGHTSANPTVYWPIKVTSATTFLLLGSVFTNAYVANGKAFPALHLEVDQIVAFTMAGIRYWGHCVIVYDSATMQLWIGGTTSGNQVIPPATGIVQSWQLGVWGRHSGFPACVAFHQNRLWFSGVPNYPQEVDSSNTGLYEYFAPSDYTNLNVKDSNSCQFTLNSEDLNPLRWMKSTAQGLLAGTNASEWAMTPSGGSEALTPTNFNAQQSSFFGSATADSVKIGNAVMYIQRAFRKLREMAFFFMAGTFRSSDITEISEHITLPSITKLGIQKETQPLVWAIRSDGALVALVYNRDDLSLSVGWTRHFLGGKADIAGSIPLVRDIAFIPDPAVTFDQMWLVIKRYINAATIYTVEYMTKITDDSISQSDSFQIDCGGTYNGAPATTISGLTWLVGETVGVLTDGGIHPDCVVDNAGAIHLNYPASKVQVGYKYKSQGKILRAEAGAADGTSIGKTRRTTRAAIQMHRVGDLAIGTDFNNLIPLNFPQADQNQADQAAPLFSGVIREGLESAYDFESQLCFEQSSPLPGTIQSITTFMEEFDV